MKRNGYITTGFPTTGKKFRRNFQRLEIAAAAVMVVARIACATVVESGNVYIFENKAAEQKPAPKKAARPDNLATNAGGSASPVLRIKTAEDAARVANELQFHPADARAWRLLGEYHFKRAEYGEAETNFSKSYELAPNDPLVANDLGASIAMLGRLDEAVRLLEANLKKHPEIFSLRFNLACIAAQQNRENDAIRYLLELEHMRWPLLQLNLTDPDLDSIRNDPPFIAIRQRVQRWPASASAYEAVNAAPPGTPSVNPGKE